MQVEHILSVKWQSRGKLIFPSSRNNFFQLIELEWLDVSGAKRSRKFSEGKNGARRDSSEAFDKINFWSLHSFGASTDLNIKVKWCQMSVDVVDVKSRWFGFILVLKVSHSASHSLQISIS
jgi:hypothetical protein